MGKQLNAASERTSSRMTVTTPLRGDLENQHDNSDLEGTLNTGDCTEVTHLG